jgi:protein TonB
MRIVKITPTPFIMKTVAGMGLVAFLAGCASVPPSCHEARGFSGNAKPAYPASSIRAGEEGDTALRVFVNARGYVETVELHRSSGFKNLDRAAIDTVRNWCFTPARTEEKPVGAWVLVPVEFRLLSSPVVK